MKRIAIDFGKTIALIEEEKPFFNAFTIIKMIIGKFMPENVFIISKANQHRRSLILQWLDKNNFFKETNFLLKNVYFVKEYHEKRVLVDKLNINVFIDDSIKVIRCIYNAPSIEKIIWFRGNSKLLSEIPIPYKKKISISNKWNRIYKFFCKIEKNG